MNPSGNRRECWQGVCSCKAGFRPTPNKKDCVKVGKFTKYIKSCKNLSMLSQISVVFNLYLSYFLQKLPSHVDICLSRDSEVYSYLKCCMFIRYNNVVV